MVEYLTVREVAAVYRVNEMTVRRHIRKGKLRAVKVGGRVRVRKEDADNLGQPVRAETWARLAPPPTPDEIARRKMVIARIDALRATMAPLGISTTDLLRLARQEDEGAENA